MNDIKSILGQDYLSRFRVFHSITLFEPSWEAIKEKRCPLCGNKLKLPKNERMYYCRGVKHKKPFIISPQKVHQISTKKI